MSLGVKERLTLDEYMMVLAWAASLRSTCRSKCGAVVTEGGFVVSTGYNGSPPGESHCNDVGCNMQMIRGRPRCIRTIHAEKNAIRRADERGDTLYTTGQPCLPCWRYIESVNSWRRPNIKRVVWWRPYDDKDRDAAWSALSAVNDKIEIVHLDLPWLTAMNDYLESHYG